MSDRASTTYVERLTAPVSWWAAAALFALSCGWIVLVATTVVAGAVSTLVVLAALVTLVQRYGSVTLTVDDTGFSVGRAHLDRRHVGDVEALHRVEYRALLGPGADVRAFLTTRPYVDRGVRVDVRDATDPVPYWLVSTRRPDDLAAAVAALTAPSDKEPTRGEA